jgi:hypothetical protein
VPTERLLLHACPLPACCEALLHRAGTTAAVTFVREQAAGSDSHTLLFNSKRPRSSTSCISPAYLPPTGMRTLGALSSTCKSKVAAGAAAAAAGAAGAGEPLENSTPAMALDSAASSSVCLGRTH